MSIKEELKNNIIIKLGNLGIGKALLGAITSILTVELQGYEVKRVETLPMIRDDENEQILKLFLCTKGTKLSKRTVKMYMYSIKRLLEFINKIIIRYTQLQTKY